MRSIGPMDSTALGASNAPLALRGAQRFEALERPPIASGSGQLIGFGPRVGAHTSRHSNADLRSARLRTRLSARAPAEGAAATVAAAAAKAKIFLTLTCEPLARSLAGAAKVN